MLEPSRAVPHVSHVLASDGVTIAMGKAVFPDSSPDRLREGR